ncbi:hypothetical protein QYF36_004298 [Acer negundo]|nr:hypothetical protein QYF36_004298 [Acer negundo]
MVAHVGDFGLAKFLSVDPLNAASGTQSSSIGIKGTIGYVAPEYASLPFCYGASECCYHAFSKGLKPVHYRQQQGLSIAEAIEAGSLSSQ